MGWEGENVPITGSPAQGRWTLHAKESGGAWTHAPKSRPEGAAGDGSPTSEASTVTGALLPPNAPSSLPASANRYAHTRTEP
jgi:hypothetical protein